MIRSIRALAWSTLVLLAASPAAAGVYTIEMTNGTEFQTRYEPIDAPWDASKIVFTDEWGNLMSLLKAEIAKVESDITASGYGHPLDDTTIAFGWAPNDAPEFGSDGDLDRGDPIGATEVGAETIDEPIYEPGETPGVTLYPGLDDNAVPMADEPPN